MNKIYDHYIILYKEFGPDSKQIKLSTLSETLSCTERHAKSLIKDMLKQGWIKWEPGRGRGNKSKITFQQKPEVVEKEQLQRWIAKGDIPKALKWMERHPLNESSKEWLKQYFFFSTSNGQSGGEEVLSYPAYRPIHSLLPWEFTTRHEAHLGEHIYNRLVVFDPESMMFVPELLYQTESFDNGRIWRLHLKKGVYFHDGSQFTAETIIAHIKLWKNHLRNGWKKSVILSITKTQIHSSYTLDLYLENPNFLFLHVFTDVNMALVSIESDDKDFDDLRSHPIGTGPYSVSFHDKSRLTLTANERYFGYRPQVDRIELYSIPNDSDHTIQQVDYRIVDNDTNTIKHYDWYRPEMGGCFIVSNHQKKGIHCDPEFRRVVSLSLDRLKLFSAHPYHEIWLPDSLFMSSPPALRQQPDIEAAKRWVEENGYTGYEITITSTRLAHNAYFGYELPILEGAFKEIGLTLHTRIVDIKKLETPEELAKTDLIITGISIGEDRLVSMLSSLTSEASFMFKTLPTYAKEYVLSQVKSIYQSSSTEEALNKLRHVEEYLLDHHYIIFLYQRQRHIHIEADERLQGIDINRYNRLRYEKLWYRSGTTLS